jgi:hypothetical protein
MPEFERLYIKIHAESDLARTLDRDAKKGD